MNQSTPDATVVYVVQQISTMVASLGLVTATIILALNGFIHDGEIVTLLVTAVGAHVVTQQVKTASAASITTSKSNPTTPTITVEPTVPEVVPTVNVGTTTIP